MDDVLVIGAGPAGLAAALQLTRHGLHVSLLEGSRPGGLLWNARCVENYLGFFEGISGPDLARLFIRHTEHLPIKPEKVMALTWEGNHFQAKTTAAVYPARAAIIASGTSPRLLSGFAITDPLRDRVFYEVFPLLGITRRNVVIVGSGDAAFDYALNLSTNNSVIILNRSAQVKCLPKLFEQVQADRNISYRPNCEIAQVTMGSQGGMDVECSSPDGSIRLQADYLIGAIGRQPQMDFITPSLAAQIVPLEQSGILHFAGDVKNGMCRQTAVAVGDGIRAAMLIHQHLMENVHESHRFKR